MSPAALLLVPILLSSDPFPCPTNPVWSPGPYQKRCTGYATDTKHDWCGYPAIMPGYYKRVQRATRDELPDGHPDYRDAKVWAREQAKNLRTGKPNGLRGLINRFRDDGCDSGECCDDCVEVTPACSTPAHGARMKKHGR